MILITKDEFNSHEGLESFIENIRYIDVLNNNISFQVGEYKIGMHVGLWWEMRDSKDELVTIVADIGKLKDLAKFIWKLWQGEDLAIIYVCDSRAGDCFRELPVGELRKYDHYKLFSLDKGIRDIGSEEVGDE